MSAIIVATTTIKGKAANSVHSMQPPGNMHFITGMYTITED